MQTSKFVELTAKSNRQIIKLINEFEIRFNVNHFKPNKNQSKRLMNVDVSY